MSDSQTGRTTSHRQERVQQAFDRAAEELDLRLERSSREGAKDEGEIRIVGTAVSVSFTKATRFDLMDSPPPVGAADDAAIEAVITTYASLSPEDLAEQWRDLAIDPFIAIADGWYKEFGQKDFRHWLRSDELAEATQEYPPFSPRHMQVTNFNIVYLSDARAVATFHLHEDFMNGKAAAGNSAASLAKLEGGHWRIVAIHKRVRREVAP
ncbi:MAG TPA: hypothetical protein VMW27_01765 [Thermoanaerobaculia bacterium]|nr:hypothetical protein [Thermoanaerobaculia bacterium]